MARKTMRALFRVFLLIVARRLERSMKLGFPMADRSTVVRLSCRAGA